MEKAYKVIEGKYYMLKMLYDESGGESPRDWDNMGTMTCFHRRYVLGDTRTYDDDVRELLEDLASKYMSGIEWMPINRYYNGEFIDGFGEWKNSELLKEVEKHYVILPLFLYDHSGITMRTTTFSCPFDSGQVGWIYCSMEDAWQNFNFFKEEGYGSMLTEQEVREKIKGILEQEVKQYDLYIQGEVFGFVLLHKEGGDEWEEVDSCWGFLGDDWTKNGMSDALGKYITDDLLAGVVRV